MSFFNKIEAIILSITIILFITMFIFQFVNFQNEETIITSKFKDFKFTPINNLDKGIIILSLENDDCKDVSVLVNGEFYSNFNKKELNIEVYNNDLIEIDGSKYLQPIKIKVIGVSKNIGYPELDTTVTTSQSIEILGKVKLK